MKLAVLTLAISLAAAAAHAGQYTRDYRARGASLPRVDFLGELVARGDLDGDGQDEAAVALTTRFGGSGVFHYLAVVAQHDQENRHVATRAIGDRVQVRGLRIAEGRIILDLIRPGPQDAACCPA